MHDLFYVSGLQKTFIGVCIYRTLLFKVTYNFSKIRVRQLLQHLGIKVQW